MHLFDRLAGKILAPVVGLSLSMVLVILLALWLQTNVADMNRKSADASAQAVESSEVRALSRAIQRDALKLTLDNWTNDRDKLNASIESRAEQLLSRARKLGQLVGPSNRAMSHDFGEMQESVVREIEAVKAAISEGHVEEARDLFRKRAEPAEKAASKLTDAFIDDVEKSAQEDLAAAAAMESSAKLLMLGVGAVALLLGVAASIWIAFGGIIFPLRRVMSAMARISAGDYAVSIVGLGRKDEIGEIAKAASAIREAALEKARLESEAAAGRADAQRERDRNERAQLEAIQRERKIVADSIGVALTQLAAKDLTYRLSASIPDAYRTLQADFNAAIVQLEQAMQSVVGCATEIATGSQQISTASDDLSGRTQQQAAKSRRVAAALGEIAATVKKSADAAMQVRSVVAATRADAERSGKVVRQTIDAMEKIERSSQEISQIITVIDEIAFQTNLLALNAGVEAARAGEAGRGFAVVASEVRALAQRAADAAKQIKTLIGASSTEVAQGVKLVAETGQSLTKIISGIGEIDMSVSHISASSIEQATVVQEVATAVNEMDQMTQQTAAMAEQSTAASRTLSSETSRLAALVGEFRVDRAHAAAAMKKQLKSHAARASRLTA